MNSMDGITHVLIGLVALIQAYICIFEMFLWERRGPKVFSSFPKDLFPKTTALAANQGLLNGFLSAGLVWTFFIDSTDWSKNIALFFLVGVAIAGIYGALTAERKIFFVQTIPSVVAIIAILVF